MKMILAIAFLIFNGIGCFGLKLPSDIVHKDKEIGLCYVRAKVVCSKPFGSFIEVMTGDKFSDPVSIDAMGEEVGEYKCLKVPCMLVLLDDGEMLGEVLGDVIIIGNGIVTKPDYLKSQTKVFTDVGKCEMADTYDFEVGCEEDKEYMKKDDEMMKHTESDEDAKLQGWQNGYDGGLDKRCSNQQGIYRVKSEHSNRAEDRRWEFFCRRTSITNWDDDYWTDYVNGFDQPIFFSCNANYYICGVNSYHSNGAEDRRWKFRCCRSPNHFTKHCDLSGYTNSFDGWMDYSVATNRVITSVYSYHTDSTEDRRWKFGYCEYKYCQGA